MQNAPFSYVHYLENSLYDADIIQERAKELLGPSDFKTAGDIIKKWPNYKPTPLVELSDISQDCGVHKILYKDESKRFHLKSFKALGGAYAVQSLANAHMAAHGSLDGFIVSTATDGNHGRSVAWGAQLLGIPCHIFIHEHVSEERAKAMAELGANIHRVNGNYDFSIAECNRMAEENKWHIVSDTSWDGYEAVPRYVMAGYSVMANEIIDQLGGDIPTHIFIQAGCGGMAAALLAFFAQYWQEKLPIIVIVESYMSDCVYQSLKSGHIKLVDIKEETLMAGLSCGEVSKIGWPIIAASTRHVITFGDENVKPIMRALHAPSPSHKTRASIEGGECSASGIIGIYTAMHANNLRDKIGLNAESSILVFGTEGATDPTLYQQVIDGDI